jgi:hypothetical protein
MNEVYILQGTHPYVPGRVLSVHATKRGAEAEAVELINIIRKDVCAGQKIFEATVDNYVNVLETLKEHYAAVHENDNEVFDVWIEKMEVLA